ncbi:hypothetical protein [Deinococcus radiotolerans]|nr:hypothetical protein [Deinococcus radiotolerans]
MSNFTSWWQRTPKANKQVLLVLCYTFIATLGINIGRALFQALHG